MAEKENEDNSFDRVLEIVGNRGFFQRRFNIIFNFFLQILIMMPTLNIVLSLAIPKHWCYVPGRENTNYSLNEWKGITIPKENNTDGLSTYSSCKMFNISDSGQNNVVDCQFGWEYDKTWYLRTAVSQENWVCDDALNVANVFAFTKIGDFLGTCIFGQLADLIGRKPTFYITLVLLFLGRNLSAFTAQYIWIFSFAALLGNLATPSVFLVPLTISMEISRSEDRASAAMFQSVGATISVCMMPFIYWYFKDWVPFMLLTSIPCGLYFFSYSYIVESPRWLAGKGKTKRCIKELRKIAKANERTITDEVAVILQANKNTEITTYGFMSLFANWGLAKKTILLVNLAIAINIMYFTILLNVNNLEGNPFMNYFLQGVVELPACMLGKYICDKFGRVWTDFGGFVFAAISSGLLFLLINNEELVLLTSILAVVLKIFTTVSMYGLNLHIIEIFPTCIRQTGISFCIFTSSAFGTLTPYIILLGTSMNLKYPYGILAGLATFAAACSILLPETLNKRLPETLEDAKDNSEVKKNDTSASTSKLNKLVVE